MLSDIVFRYTQILIRNGTGIGIEIQIVSAHYNWAWISHKQIKPVMEIEPKIIYGLVNNMIYIFIYY